MTTKKMILFLPVALMLSVVLMYCSKSPQPTVDETASVNAATDRGPCTVTFKVTSGAITVCGLNPSGTLCSTYGGSNFFGSSAVLTSANTPITFTVSAPTKLLGIYSSGGGGGIGGGADQATATVTTSAGSTGTFTVSAGANDTKVITITAGCTFF
jgi:hypothetical protein